MIKKIKNKILNIKYPYFLLLIIFVLHLFLRFYDLEGRTVFGWDQVDNAWAAKDIIVDHKIPLVGMVAKQNTGFYIGPIYYYFVALFYWIFKMDPISSGVISGVTSILTIFILFYIIRKLLSTDIALVASFLHTISLHIVNYDRLQWPINLVAPISLIIFYSLYNIMQGKLKYMILLTSALGFSFHLNFTSIFFPLIIVLTLPFWPRTKESIKYALLSMLVFFVWLVPNIVSEVQKQASASRNMANYVSTYYHGFHFVRFLQLANDAFIEIGALLQFRILQILKFFIYPIFCLAYFREIRKEKKFIMCYLVGLWFLVPWIVFSTYKGEITDYYFSLTRPIAIMIVSYLVVQVFKINNIIPKIALLLFFVYYAFINISNFFTPKYRPLSYYRKEVLEKIKRGEKIEFEQGSPQSYIYYYYTSIK